MPEGSESKESRLRIYQAILLVVAVLLMALALWGPLGD